MKINPHLTACVAAMGWVLMLSGWMAAYVWPDFDHARDISLVGIGMGCGFGVCLLYEKKSARYTFLYAGVVFLLLAVVTIVIVDHFI